MQRRGRNRKQGMSVNRSLLPRVEWREWRVGETPSHESSPGPGSLSAVLGAVNHLRWDGKWRERKRKRRREGEELKTKRDGR